MFVVVVEYTENGLRQVLTVDANEIGGGAIGFSWRDDTGAQRQYPEDALLIDIGGGGGGQGPPGPQGIPGTDGAPGQQGIQGVPGPAGKDGVGIHTEGAVTTASLLPTLTNGRKISYHSILGQ